MVVFLIQTFSADGGASLVRRFGFIAANITSRFGRPFSPVDIPPGATLITYVFLHASWIHLLGNMIYLWTFADNVEDATGHVQFVVFFLLCAIVAAFAQAWPDPGARSPVIGASGGLAGVLGAYLLLHPRAEISIAIPIVVDIEIVQLPAWVMLIGWFIFEFVLNYFAAASGTVVAFRAHIGGFIAGIILIPLFVPDLRAALRTRLSL